MPTPTTDSPTPAIGDDVDLASLLPTKIAANAMTIEPASDSARSFLILWNDEQVARDLLNRLGKTPADVSIVYSYTTKNMYPQTLAVDAYRVAGADGQALAQGMIDNYLAIFQASGYPPSEAVPATVGGKQVIILRPKSDPPMTGTYFYAVGDVVFVISTNPLEWTNEALALLP